MSETPDVDSTLTYLDVWNRDIEAGEDPALFLESAGGGPDTSVRTTQGNADDGNCDLGKQAET